jgi:arylsulfatase A-like enzyme
VRRLAVGIVIAAIAGACGKGGGARPAGPGSDAGSGAAVAVGSGADAADAIDAAPAARIEHAAWKAGDNRMMAHRLVDGDLVVDAATTGVARYHRFGMPAPHWKLNAVVDGEKASTTETLPALEVPLTAEQIGAAAVVVRIHVAEPGRLAVRINGGRASDAPVPLIAGWQTVVVPVAAGRWQIGENLIAFDAGRRAQVGIAWLRVAKAAAPSTDDPRAAGVFDPATDAFTFAGGAGLAWYVVIPVGANLVGDVVGDPACRIEVGAKTSDGTFVGGLLAGAGARVDLSSLAGRAVRLELVVRDCDRATLTGGRITLHGEQPVVPAPGPPPRYVVLWVMDAQRADRIPVFQPGTPVETPAFDELAKGGVVFRQFYVQGNESQTSHASIWTGLYPATHGVRGSGSGGKARIDKSMPVLGAQIKAAGYATAGVTGNGFVTDYGGYARGFDLFRNLMREKEALNAEIKGTRIAGVALEQLDGLRADPTFVFLGTIDTHSPHIGQQPWLDRYDPHYRGPLQRVATAEVLGLIKGRMGCHKVPPQKEIDRFRVIYDTETSYQDSVLGGFVEALKTRGIYDQTMIVITADHGEELYEDGVHCGHGGSLRETLIRVPLLVHYPARFPGGTIVEEGAEGVDILPTILDAIDAPAVDSVQGTSLRPLAHGVGKGWAAASYASQYERAHAMRIGKYKIRVGKSGMPKIEDLQDDPGEHGDYVRTRPVERRMLTDHLGLFLSLRSRWKKATWGGITNMSAVAATEIDADPPAPEPAPEPPP